MIGIYLTYNPNTGEGDLRIRDDFKKNGRLLQLDVIQDWSNLLEDLRREADDNFYGPMRKEWKNDNT